MKHSQAAPRVDLRAFRWPLEPLERRLDGAVESARLAIAGLQRQLHAFDDAARHRLAHQREQEQRALRSARHDVRAGALAVRYLASLEAARRDADAARAELEQRVAAARAACAQRQRELESVQALRRAAQREHAQQQLRRECREADAAWLALRQQRRAAAARAGGEAA